MAYQHISVAPMSGALGAEVTAPALLQLGAGVRDAAVAEIYDAWLEHHVVVFRDLSLTPAEQAEFCSLFGELDTYPFVEATSDHPNVIPIIKEPQQKLNFGGAWHTDTSYMEVPPKATCLYAIEVPERGGDTLFASTAKAYRSLSAGMKAMTADLVGMFTPSMVHGKTGAYGKVKHGMQAKESPDVVDQRVPHPVIRTHPESGVQAIYATPVHCEHFENMTRSESLPLLNYLYEHATRPEFTMRLSWRPGTFAMWDNRCVFHNAINDYQGQRREVHRVTLKGELPA